MDDKRLFDYQGLFVGVIQSIFTGILICGVMGAVTWYLAMRLWPLILGAFFVGAFYSWSWYLAAWKRALFAVYDVQEVEPVEIIEPAPQAVKVIKWDDDKRGGEVFDLPVTPSQLQVFAAGVLAGASLAINYWSNSEYFTRSEFERFRGALISNRLAEDKGSNQGLKLTRPGQAAMKYYAHEMPF